jgi:2-dehydro-3-deoxyphosphogluconate aldolase/(4S)-4-hydroxy-2-oxoglutarate aldolase
MTLSAMGFPVLKFFPAEPSGGARWLAAVAEPLPGARFCPTGGVNSDNAAAYLALPNVVAVGGSWVASRSAIAARDFAGITARSRAASALRRGQPL